MALKNPDTAKVYTVFSSTTWCFTSYSVCVPYIAYVVSTYFSRKIIGFGTFSFFLIPEPTVGKKIIGFGSLSFFLISEPAVGRRIGFGSFSFFLIPESTVGRRMI